MKNEIRLETISIKKFLLITLLSSPMILFLSLGLAFFTNTQWLIYLVIPLLGLTVYLAQRLSKTVTRIELNEGEQFKINHHEISYNSVVGYFINNTGLTQVALCLRLKTNKTFQITGSSLGEQGKAFNNALIEIIETLKRKNKNIRELEYQDVYVRQTNILRPILFVLVGLVIILDILTAYFFVTGTMFLPWQIIFVNFLLVGILPILKKSKSTSNNS